MTRPQENLVAPANIVLVFGSNLSGRHGKGAALDAHEKYGAVYGVGEGRTGNAYAIPTKGNNLEPLNLAQVQASISRFLDYARNTPTDIFLLTPVGTGLAALHKRDIWKTLKSCGVPENVVLTSSWLD